MMVPANTDAISLDVLDHIWEATDAVLSQA